VATGGILYTLMQSDKDALWQLLPHLHAHLHLHLQFNPYTSIFPRCRQHHAEGGWHPRVALEALQQAGVLQSVPQHVGGSRQEGSLLCA